MSQQDKLRDALRAYHDTRQFQPDENEWERASAHIASARRGRRIRSFVCVFTAVATALFIAFLAFPETAVHERGHALSHSNHSIKSVPILKQEDLREPLKPGLSEMSPHPKHTIRLQHAAPVVIPVPNTVAPHPEVVAAPSPVLPASDTHATIPEPGSISQSTSGYEEPAPAHNDDLPLIHSTNRNDAIDHSSQNLPIAEASGEMLENPASVMQDLKEMAGNEKVIAEKNNRRETEKLMPEAAPTIPANDRKNEMTTEDPPKYTLPPVAVMDTSPDISREVLFTGSAPDTEIVAEDSVCRSESSLQLADEGVFYEAGAAWLYGWKGASGFDARGFSPVGGINYMNPLGSRIALSFGLQYLQVPDLFISSKTSRESFYKYGEQSRVTVITPSSVHYIVAPLRFHYYADRANVFGAGINLAYLLNVDATVTSYDEKPGFTGNYETVKLGGYTQGFSWYDSQLAFFYRRRIARSLGLQAEIFLGLTDVKQDDFFGMSDKERNSGAKVTLIYYAFRKTGK